MYHIVDTVANTKDKDQGKVKLLPFFRSSEVTKPKTNITLATLPLRRDDFGDEFATASPPQQDCKYTCDNWPYKVCRVNHPKITFYPTIVD